jgi:hypothetical protein
MLLRHVILIECSILFSFMKKGVCSHIEALKLIEECVSLRARILGANHPYTSSSLNIT